METCTFPAEIHDIYAHAPCGFEEVILLEQWDRQLELVEEEVCAEEEYCASKEACCAPK
jgi:hypothetical protein